jgi:hypothetical protein
LFEGDAPKLGSGAIETSLLALSSRLAVIARRLELCSLRRTAVDLRAISESLASIATAVGKGWTAPANARIARGTPRDHDNESMGHP